MSYAIILLGWRYIGATCSCNLFPSLTEQVTYVYMYCPYKTMIISREMDMVHDQIQIWAVFQPNRTMYLGKSYIGVLNSSAQKSTQSQTIHISHSKIIEMFFGPSAALWFLMYFTKTIEKYLTSLSNSDIKCYTFFIQFTLFQLCLFVCLLNVFPSK